ncbi:MAG: helix-turn-helix transcriptional regulator [Candidatus Limnocylindria bacterium]
MQDEVIGRGLRALRHRRGWRQRDLSAMAGIARSVIADFEAGRIGSHSVKALRRVAEAGGGWIRIELLIAGGDVRRILDADHAQLQSHWKGWLERHGWLVDAELTFNHYGERGSIDLYAWHAASRTLLVIEIKTAIVDVQSLLAGMDRKTRIGRQLARERGWRPGVVVPVLLVAEGTTARRRILEHASLFSGLSLRGRTALTWLAEPRSRTSPAGVLCMTKLPRARSDDRRRAGRQRVRLPRTAARS